jgi:hypothetical protein
MHHFVETIRYLVARGRQSLIGAGLAIFVQAVPVPAHCMDHKAYGPADVDLQLILAVDVSPSMSKDEQRVQRDGYVSAFRHPDIATAIKSGETGRIAVLYLEWAGPGQQTVIVPWTTLDGLDDITSLADKLAALSLTEGRGTSISGALSAAQNLFATSGLISPRKVIDVSGDGPNNIGLPIDAIRETLLADGVTINGLPIALPSSGGADRFARYGGSGLQSYFEDCVIGGPDAFTVGVTETGMFATAIRRKLVREISADFGRVIPAAYIARPARRADCNAIGQAPGR